MFQFHSFLRERVGWRQPPAERSPVLSLEHKKHHQVLGEVPGTRYQVVRVCTRLFAFVVDFVLHLGPLRDFFVANFTRTNCRSERDIANMQHSTDRAISPAQVALALSNC